MGLVLDRASSVPLRWLIAASLALGGCGSSDHAPSDAPPPFVVAQGGASGLQTTTAKCATPEIDCPCDEPGEVVECGHVQRQTTDYLFCAVGERECLDTELWGECITDQITVEPAPKVGNLPLALNQGGACANSCDPFCDTILDSGDDLSDLPSGVSSSLDGLAIEPTPIEISTDHTCTSVSLTPSSSTITVTRIDAIRGLKGEYFNQSGRYLATEVPAAWTATSTRFDSTVDFSWGSGSPGVTGIGNDDFTVRWTGRLLPDEDEDYRIHTISDDGIRVWLNGSLIIDQWRLQGPTEVISNQLPLEAGEEYDLRVEYFERGGGATARLYWSSGSMARTIIPEDSMFPPIGEGGEFTTAPESIQFEAELQPDGCFEGIASPAFTLDQFDSSTIDDSGLFRTFAGLSGEIGVTAYLGEFSESATVTVEVDVLETVNAPAGSVTDFENAVGIVDPGSILYPYADTIFPLGLQAPTIQYDDGGTAADAVKISLIYPETGTPTFTWSSILPESSPGRVEIPISAWKAFEQTAKAERGIIQLQRLVGGTPMQAIDRPIEFATAPLRGKIYYTQYGRSGGSKLMLLDPGVDEPASDAFGTSSGCPVCHSVSSRGTVLATSERRWSAQGGLSELLDTGYASPVSDHPGDSVYKQSANDWRGFAWAPLDPDGDLALVANNIYGNTTQNIVGIDTSTDTVSVPDELISGSNGTGLLAEYYSDNNWGGTRWARLVPHVNENLAADGPGEPIGVDFTARYSGQVVPYFTEDTTFTVVSDGGVELTVDGVKIIDDLAYAGAARAISADIGLTAKVPTDIELRWRDTGSTAELSLSWDSERTPQGLVPIHQLFPAGGDYGVVTDYYSDNNFSTYSHTVVEPEIYANWGSSGQFGLSSNNFSSEWRAEVEIPTTVGDLSFCLRSDDDVYLEWNGAPLINQTGVSDSCSAGLFVTAGTTGELLVRHREFSGGAYVELTWQSSDFARTRVSEAYLRPLPSYVPPANGLLASYYDGADFLSGLDESPQRPGAMSTYVDDVYNNWGSSRPDFVALTSSDTFSVRYSGSITMPCDGIYEFQNISDDGSSVWIGENRLVHYHRNGTQTGSAYFEAGTYDFKYDLEEGGGGAGARLSWIPRCQGDTTWTPVPSSAFTPDAGNAEAGFAIAGGDNQSYQGYWVWDTQVAVGGDPIDVTDDSPGRWGLGETAMMVPSFSPDGQALVFVDGDQAGGAGWRKGLSVFNFDKNAQLFWERRSIVNTWPYGDVIKWPVFESDSRSVLYQTTNPVDWCCKGGWTRYGHMAPTNYFEIPGLLWSVDSESASPDPQELRVLNEGERPADANKSYQPTTLPAEAGGYRWVVFTSTRPYGNTFNLAGDQEDYSDPNSFTPMVRDSSLQSMLWVAAVDDEVSDGTDRSHPAFLLPNQNYSTTGSGGYLNERGFWTLDECRPPGTGDDSACEVDEDCCGGDGASPTAVCRIDTPVTSPPTRHCKSRPDQGMCSDLGDVCESSSDCCLGGVCIDTACAEPPPLLTLVPVNFEREFVSDCGAATATAVWRYFDYKATTPGDSYIEFYAQSEDDPSEYIDLPESPTIPSGDNLIGVATAAGNPGTGWVGTDVGALLDAAGVEHSSGLKITMRFVASSDGTESPVVHEWRQTYSCPPDK